MSAELIIFLIAVILAAGVFPLLAYFFPN